MGKKQPSSKLPVIAPHAQGQKAFAHIEIVKGPHKGKSYKLVGAKVSIGRSKKNDLILDQDEKCSRQQVVIHFNNSHYTIKDVSNRTTLKINDKPQVNSILQDGDIIEFGHTILRFFFKSPPSAFPSAATHIPMSPAPGQIHSPPLGLDKQHLSAHQLQANNLFPSAQAGIKKKTRRQRPPKKSIRPKVLMLLIGCTALYLFTSNTTPTPQEDTDKLKTLQDIEEDIKTLEELREDAKEQHDETKTHNFKNAQFAYIRGIRDFRKGVYPRAIEAFKTCKTIDPQHNLCTSYLQKSQMKQQQLIQAWMITGKAYRERQRFTACMSAFKNVMTSLSNPQNLTYKEAKQNYDICSFHHLKGRY